MPITVEVRVNSRPIKQYRIGRAEGFAEPDSLNKYRIVEFLEAEKNLSKVWADGIEFEHRYGDGIDVCIQKGLEALNKGIK